MYCKIVKILSYDISDMSHNIGKTCLGTYSSCLHTAFLKILNGNTFFKNSLILLTSK